MPGPSIENVFPSDDQQGVVLGTPVWVIFDREVDPTTIEGNFVVEGPDTDRWTGPGTLVWHDRGDEEEILDSPQYKGFVQGTFSYELLDSSNNVVTTGDTSGGSNGDTAYKHKVTFTPSKILSTTTAYTTYLGGDEDSSDSLNLGIATRTVFDTVADGSNTGTGTVNATGGYIGGDDDVLNFKITKAGGFGVAEYEWWRDSDLLDIKEGVVTQQDVNLVGSDGVSVTWSGATATPFQLNDKFTVQLRSPFYMDGTFTWNFTTGSGSITTVPSSTSTSPIGTIGLDPEVALEVVEVQPDIRATNLPLSTRVVKITFNKDIDASTVTDKTVTLEALPVNGDDSIPFLGEISKILSVSGKTIYAILQSGQKAAN